MTPAEIDDAILAVVEVHWKKVAMVVSRAAEKLRPGLPDGDDGYRIVANRIEALVTAGRLASQGEISSWRHSEVRLP